MGLKLMRYQKVKGDYHWFLDDSGNSSPWYVRPCRYLFPLLDQVRGDDI
jgi:hypothetical protein